MSGTESGLSLYTLNDDGTVTLKSKRLTPQQAAQLEHDLNKHLDRLAGKRADDLLHRIKHLRFPVDKQPFYREAFYAMFYADLEGEINVCID